MWVNKKYWFQKNSQHINLFKSMKFIILFKMLIDILCIYFCDNYWKILVGEIFRNQRSFNWLIYLYIAGRVLRVLENFTFFSMKVSNLKVSLVEFFILSILSS